MKKRIALILTMVMLATSIYVPTEEVYAKPQEDDPVIFDEDVVTTGEREIPEEYLTFDQGMTDFAQEKNAENTPEIRDREIVSDENAETVDRETVSGNEPVETALDPGKRTELILTSGDNKIMSFSPAESGYYLFHIETSGDPDNIYIDGSTVIEGLENSWVTMHYLYGNYVEGGTSILDYAVFCEKARPYRFTLYTDRDFETEVSVTLSGTEEVSVDSKAEAFTIPANQKFVHLTTNFKEKTYFDVNENGYTRIAKAEGQTSNGFEWLSSKLVFDAGECGYILYNNGKDDVKFNRSRITMEESADEMSLELSSTEKWVKYIPAETGFYSMYMPYDTAVNVDRYKSTGVLLQGIDAKRWTDRKSCIYTMYLQANTEYYFAFSAGKPKSVSVKLKQIESSGVLQLGENKLSVIQNGIYMNPFQEEGLYYLRIKDGSLLNLDFKYKYEGYKKNKTIKVGKNGVYISVSGRLLPKRNPYIEIVTNLSAENTDSVLEISKLNVEEKTLILDMPYTQEVTENVQSYTFTAPKTGNYVCRIQTKTQWTDEQQNAFGQEFGEKVLDNGQYEYTYRRYLFSGTDWSLDIIQDQAYTITMEEYYRRPILDYDQYMAFIASGGSIIVENDWNEDYEEDENCGYIWSDPRCIYADARNFKDKDHIWLLSENGHYVSWINDWYGEYDQYKLDYDKDEKVSVKINQLNQEESFYKITDIYTVTGDSTMSPKKKNASDTLGEDDDIILVKSVPDTVYVQKIKLNGKTALTKGEKATVTATIDTLNKYQANDPNVSFTSSDSSVLKVSATGEIEAVSAGKADVICKSADGNATEKMTVTVTEPAKPAPSPTPAPVPTPSPTPAPEKKGTVVQSEKESGKYKVTNADKENPAVEYTGQTKTDKKKKTVSIPSKVESNGVAYEVTSIAAKSFKNNRAVTTVKMPATIKKIGSSAFEGCSKLKAVTIGKETETIGKNAFKNCKSLKTITIKSTNLKTIDKTAFKNVNKKCVIKVPKKKLKAYKKLFKKKGIKLKLKAI